MRPESTLIILDRDGVLNRMVPRAAEPTGVDSPLSPEEVEVFPWVPRALALLTEGGYRLAIATNQPAAAKGKVGRDALEAVHRRVLDEAQAGGGAILSSHVCFHRREDRCACRKPAVGLLVEALRLHADCRPEWSWMVGDRITDVQAGRDAGLNTALLGETPADDGPSPTFRGANLMDFAEHLVTQGVRP